MPVSKRIRRTARSDFQCYEERWNIFSKDHPSSQSSTTADSGICLPKGCMISSPPLSWWRVWLSFPIICYGQVHLIQQNQHFFLSSSVADYELYCEHPRRMCEQTCQGGHVQGLIQEHQEEILTSAARRTGSERSLTATKKSACWSGICRGNSWSCLCPNRISLMTMPW